MHQTKHNTNQERQPDSPNLVSRRHCIQTASAGMWMIWLTLVGWSSVHGEEASKAAKTPPTPAAQHTMLFLDDEPLNQRDRVVRRLGQPTLIPESVYHETAGNCAWAYPGVFRDPVTGRWRMVFQAGVRAKNGGGGTVLLLESEDGLRWQPRDTTRELPDLQGRRAPHQILPADRLNEFSSFFVDEFAPAEERLKILTNKRQGSEGHDAAPPIGPAFARIS